MDKNDYNLGDQHISESLFITNTIYIDIEFLKFVGLGNILAHQNLSEIPYTGIVNIILGDSFSTRYTNDISVLFKDVKAIDNILDIENQRPNDIRFQVSPSFHGAVELIQNCILKSEASKKMSSNKKPLRVLIDTSKAEPLSDNMHKQIIAEYSVLFDTNVILLTDGLTVADVEVLDFDTYFISDLSSFTHNTFDQLNSDKFLSKRVFCSKVLPLSKLPDLEQHDIPMTFNSIELAMTAATKFNFIDPFPCLVTSSQ